jgi:hypothetical protein
VTASTNETGFAGAAVEAGTGSAAIATLANPAAVARTVARIRIDPDLILVLVIVVMSPTGWAPHLVSEP